MGKTYLGLDIGTDSIGWAVTDEKYKLKKFHGEPMWGSVLFEAANHKAERRASRISRRLLNRRKQRVQLIQELFAEEINKVDPNFYKRLRESALYREDKNSQYTLFEDEHYTDREYHKKYPTIHHLIVDLMNSEEPHDVRLVYLACAWLVAHRGHFLSEVSKENISAVLDFQAVYRDLAEYILSLSDGYSIPWKEEDSDALRKILPMSLTPTNKYKELKASLFPDGKLPKDIPEEQFPFSCEIMLKALCGSKIAAKDLFRSSAYEDIETFSLSSDDETIAGIIADLGDDGELIIRLKAIYDWSVLIDVLNRNSISSDKEREMSISDAKVRIYHQHAKDLKNLKYLVRKYLPSKYNEIFRSEKEGSYTAYQSYGYEEFIEGIKPKLNAESETLGYTIEDGVFKEFCRRASAVKVQETGTNMLKEQPRIWGMLLGGSGMTELKRQCFDRDEVRIGFIEVDDNDVEDDFASDATSSWQAKHMVFDFKNTMEIGDIVVIEKNNTSIDAIGVVTGDYKYDKSLDNYPRSRAVKWLVKDIDQNMLQYLPNGRKQLSRFSLFAFDYIGMDVISQILNENTAEPVVEVDQETKPYIFIIDEINRGNISKIFGELITLIEDTKRAGTAEAVEAILPYSGETFSVPNNVYILGTMNTADRSIALMDTALRRRFEFVEMMPNSEVLESLGVGTIEVSGVELKVARMLDVINERIEYLFDREHTIGHSFFTKLAEDPSIETLAGIFEKNVIPLLQEYFYEDYEKIQLVLGDNTKEDEFKFILDRSVKAKDIFNGNPDIDLPEKGYVVQHEAFLKLESYKQIGKDL